MRPYCVLTTINSPTKSVEKLHDIFGSNLIVVGDVKTPTDWNYKDTTYIPVDRVDNKAWFEGYDPINHYARKNVGYLEAIRKGAELIYETDDDNCPNENWKLRVTQIEANESEGEGWYNVYEAFCKDIWPRGFSLRHIQSKTSITIRELKTSSIQQGLADGEPDIDAICRLVKKQDKNFKFNEIGSLYLKPNTWCPFNSQSTWWFPKAYQLMYLPVYASFRMTDIYRSFVAQKCLWSLGEGVTFHSPSEVYQDRNEHDLLKDFEQEVHGYLNVDVIVETLQGLKLKQGEENICDNMLTCYQAMVDKGILPEMEMRSLNSWIKKIKKIWTP